MAPCTDFVLYVSNEPGVIMFNGPGYDVLFVVLYEAKKKLNKFSATSEYICSTQHILKVNQKTVTASLLWYCKVSSEKLWY